MTYTQSAISFPILHNAPKCWKSRARYLTKMSVYVICSGVVFRIQICSICGTCRAYNIYSDLYITLIPNFPGTVLIHKDLRKLRLASSNP